MQADLSISLVRTKQLCAELGISRTTLWRLVKSGDFPAPIQIGKNSIAWRRQVISDYLDSKQPSEAA